MSSFDQLSKRARKLEKQGQIDEAIKLYELFLQDFPKNTRAKAALEKLRKAETGTGISAQAAFVKASEFIDQGAYSKGLSSRKAGRGCPGQRPGVEPLGLAASEVKTR